MRYAFFSDLHASHAGLSKLIAHDEFLRADKKICLGDVFNATDASTAKDYFAKVKDASDIILLGNHEAVFVDKCDVNVFSSKARQAIIEAQTVISKDMDFVSELKNLPETFEEKSVQAKHASFDPKNKWSHIRYTEDVQAQAEYFTHALNIIGHGHIPFIAWEEDGYWFYQRQIYDTVFTLDADRKYVVNAGSILGSREMRQHERTFLIYDDEAMTVRFYNLEAV